MRLLLERLEDRSVLSGLFGDSGAGEMAVINSLVVSWENAVNSLVVSWENAVNSLVVSWEKDINALDGLWGLPPLFPGVAQPASSNPKTPFLSVQITGLPESLTSPEGTTINLGSQVTGPPHASYQYQWTVTENGKTYASGNESSFSFTLGAPGNYTVILTVTDNQKKTATASATIVSTAAGVPNEPLLYSSDLQLVGAFRLPGSMAGDSSTPGFGFANGVLGYDPTKNALFVTGFQEGAGDRSIGEVSIPSTIVNSSNLNDLTTATELQPLVDFIPNMPNPMPSDASNNGQYVGGLLVYNGQLVGTDYAYYTGSVQPASDFTLSSLNLSTASVQGLYSVGGADRLAAGWLIPVPSEWQAVLGYPVLTGQGDTNNIASVSSGPALLGLNPSDLSYSTPAPTTTFLDYPVSNPLGPYDGEVDPLQNGTTEIGGGVFVPGTSTVLFFGVTGTNYDSYGLPGQDGPWSLDGQYALQVWAYDAKDLVAVKQGLLQPWQVQPYDVWNFHLPIESNYYFDGTHRNWVGGVAFDPSTDRIYLSIAGADTGNPYEPMPLIYAFQVNVPSGPPTSAPPQVGTMAATPTDLSSLTLTGDGGDATTGPLPAGTSVTLTAGNVYAITPGANITQVAFYLDTDNDGILDSGDQLLGDGTPSTIPNAQHNYTLTMSTAGLTSGTYTLFAQATDSNGQVSNVVETTMTIS